MVWYMNLSEVIRLYYPNYSLLYHSQINLVEISAPEV